MTADSVHEALKHISGKCDGAGKQDGEGFNKFDAAFGKEMAEKLIRGEDLTPKEHFRACKMLQKYSKQLLEIGIAKEDLEPETSPSGKPYDPIDWRIGYFIGIDGQIYQGWERVDKDDGKTKQSIKLICEGYAYLYKIIETIGQDSNIFVFKAKPAHDEEADLKITAKDASQSRKLNAELVNRFGADDVKGLNLSIIKALSEKIPEYIRLFKKPQWFNGQIVAPGLDIKDAQFEFMQKVVVDFNTDGDASIGVNALETIVNAFNPSKALIGIVTFLGAPVVAYLWKGDRFALFIIGVTGSMKTAFVMLLSSIYGQGYSYEANILRWGDGTTSNAAAHIAALTGPFVFVLDNYKAYSTKDPAEMQKLVHGILEGAEKARMQQDSNNLRDSEEYLCTPVITGENYPGQDAATRARIVQLDWEKPKDIDCVTEAQEHIADINALGNEWCLWLSSDEGKAAMKAIESNFIEVRSDYIKKVGDTINAGRIATNAAIIHLIWQLLGLWSVTAEFVRNHDETLDAAINDHILYAKEDVNSSTEADKFISWLRAQIEIGRYYISSCNNSIANNMAILKTSINIAHYRETEGKKELLMQPDILDNILLPEWQRTANGVRADKKSLRKQLHQRKYIQYDEKNKSFTFARKINGKNTKVLVFDAYEVLQEQIEVVTGSDEEVVAQNQLQEA
jgi:hypothetical protein